MRYHAPVKCRSIFACGFSISRLAYFIIEEDLFWNSILEVLKE